MSTPASNPLFLPSKFSAEATPGIKVVNCTKLRPLSGNSRTSCPFTTLPTVPVCVSTETAEVCTSTTSAAAPTGNWRLRLVMSPTCDETPLLDIFLNPSLLTVTSYSPGDRSGKLKDPCASVVAVRLAPVCVDVTVTLAP